MLSKKHTTIAKYSHFKSDTLSGRCCYFMQHCTGHRLISFRLSTTIKKDKNNTRNRQYYSQTFKYRRNTLSRRINLLFFRSQTGWFIITAQKTSVTYKRQVFIATTAHKHLKFGSIASINVNSAKFFL